VAPQVLNLCDEPSALSLLPQEKSYRHPQDRWLTCAAGKRKTFPLGQNLEFLGSPVHSRVVATPAEMSSVLYERYHLQNKGQESASVPS